MTHNIYIYISERNRNVWKKKISGSDTADLGMPVGDSRAN
jgi:hypothetical protein